MAKRKHNFNAGPAALPLEVLERVAANLVDHDALGLSVLEMSHRSAPFQAIADRAIGAITRLYSVPDTHEVLLLQGGASLQFAMVPYNLGLGGAFINTGTWTTRALAEARCIGGGVELWSGESDGFRHLPTDDELPPAPDSAPYLHYCSNNTIYGTQFHHVPDVGLPLVCDMSSDFMSRPIDVSRYAVIFAGAQKNAGPSGVTIVIVDKRFSRSFEGAASVPKILRYQTQAEKGSLYNTPNTFGFLVLAHVAEWVETHGGLEGIAARNAAKAAVIYAAIDANPLFAGHAEVASRSLMNVTFVAEPSVTGRFLEAAAGMDMIGLKGHRSVGGLRASIYNAVPEASCAALAELIGNFRSA